jgi:molybdopterin molybdotransferase
MPEFLNLMSTEIALGKIEKYLDLIVLPQERIKTENGLNRILSKSIDAAENLPAFTRSTVDGYAIISRDTHGVTESLPGFFTVIGEVKMGESTELKIGTGQVAIIHTGGMLPAGADAVIMIENTQVSAQNEIEVLKAVGSGENLILAGEDVHTGDKVFESGTRLRPGDIGGLMALGQTEILVFQRPSIGIVSTGDEVVAPDKMIKIGQVRDINSYTLSCLVEKYNCKPVRYPIVPDNSEKLTEIMQKAYSENDLVIVTAGSSASVRDLTADVIQTLGEPGVLVHGVNVRPGKPTILAVCNGKPIIGLPGNPVSAYVIAHMFVVPIIEKLSGINKPFNRVRIPGKISINVGSVAGREDWIPVKFLKKNPEGILIVEPIFYKSNLIFSIIRADGFIRIKPDVTGLMANEDVEIILV